MDSSFGEENKLKYGLSKSFLFQRRVIEKSDEKPLSNIRWRWFISNMRVADCPSAKVEKKYERFLCFGVLTSRHQIYEKDKNSDLGNWENNDYIPDNAENSYDEILGLGVVHCSLK